MGKKSFCFILILGLVSSVWVVFVKEEFQVLPVVIFSGLTAVFSFCAYKFAHEKFRLDLFEKRWEIYEKTLGFCSKVTTHGGIPKHSNNEELNKDATDAIIAAHESFRGIGLHKTRTLFGEDIHELFDKLNDSYSWLVSFEEQPIDAKERSEWSQKERDHLIFVWETIKSLPDVFKPYMYFGDYKEFK